MKLYTDAELAQILDKKIFHKIGEVADEMGVECYLVGGYVRDIFSSAPRTTSTSSSWAAA